MRINLSFSVPDNELNEFSVERRTAELMLRLGVPVESVQISYSTDAGLPTKITDIVNEELSHEFGEESVLDAD